MTDTVENMPRWRLLVLALLVVGALWTLIARLHTLQVKQSDDFESSQIRQSVRRVLLPAPRGRIFDRNGLCLADNRPSYCIAVYAEELRKPGAWSNTVNAVDARIDELSAALGIERQISRDDIRQHVAKRLPPPLLAWQDIDERTKGISFVRKIVSLDDVLQIQSHEQGFEIGRPRGIVSRQNRQGHAAPCQESVECVGLFKSAVRQKFGKTQRSHPDFCTPVPEFCRDVL